MSELQPDALLQGGKYRIEKTLGQGGFGITYLAEQTNLGRKVCIKEFFMKEYGERTSASVADGDATVLTGVSGVTSAAAEIMGRYREKFIKEARTISRMDHPGIVRIHDVFEENGTAYYVMDYIEGENLNDLIKRDGALSENRALGYIRQVAYALSYVHSQNVMHLDVKPANIIIRKSDDRAILIDFGAAKQYDSEGTQTSTTPVGLSAGYAPIEMMKVGGVQTFSPETDVYSLGATLYYLVTGQNPPEASVRMEMLMEGEKLEVPKSVSIFVIDAIETAMQSRKQRPRSISEFLHQLMESTDTHLSAEPEKEEVPKRFENILENGPEGQSLSTKKPVSVIEYSFNQDNSSTISFNLRFDVDTSQFSEKDAIVGVLRILDGDEDSDGALLYVIYANFADITSNECVGWHINFLEFDDVFFEKGIANFLYLYLYRVKDNIAFERMSAEEIVDELSEDNKFYTISFDVYYRPHLFKDDEFLFNEGVNAYGEDEK